MAASVCSAWAMENPCGAWIVRSSPETTPVLRLRLKPNGLPITASGSPTASDWMLPSTNGCNVRPDGLTCRTETSFEVSVPSTVAVRTVPFRNLTVIVEAPATTCEAVKRSPCELITIPVPVSVDWPGGVYGSPFEPEFVPVASIATTPGAALAKSELALSAPPALDSTEACGDGATTVVGEPSATRTA